MNSKGDTAMTKISLSPKTRRSFLRLSALGAASLALPGGRVSAQAPAIIKLPKKITLKMATITAESFPYVDGFKFWKKAIETRTGGEADVQIFHTAQLGDER